MNKRIVYLGFSTLDDRVHLLDEDYIKEVIVTELPMFILNKEQINRLEEYLVEIKDRKFEIGEFYNVVLDYIREEFSNVPMLEGYFDEEEEIFVITKDQFREFIEYFIGNNNSNIDEYYIVFDDCINKKDLLIYPIKDFI